MFSWKRRVKENQEQEKLKTTSGNETKAKEDCKWIEEVYRRVKKIMTEGDKRSKE